MASEGALDLWALAKRVGCWARIIRLGKGVEQRLGYLGLRLIEWASKSVRLGLKWV